MLNTTVTNFRKDIYNLLEQTIKFNEPVNVSTKNGNAIVLSEDEYNGMVETLYLYSVPELKEQLKKDMNAPLSEFVSEDEVDW
ncbi:type II toxin-antitoxin system Phd/YefM family antitoxin [Streptococcus gallolyticus]|uniref:Antitoxin n=1 Tax=Streptococcus gallolyticus TaxID=315405 RepID=A0A139R2T0_9STRE|nr:type II toxin-antitoxin system Phd/YefM family antitoxin [Streptococcus gallolyticus]KXT64427.1 RelB/StbD replicon stabilization protein (antitoxin to RelE/StbE) [Streptococcus gallolyticus]KXU09150.1 RelB/StbD replicon stabilization protein (antitoxin to RelE/StbE) [Streptococcus gallolyticus]